MIPGCPLPFNPLQVRKNRMNQKKIYLFFDEIQKLKDWQDQIKILHDLEYGTSQFKNRMGHHQ